MINLYLRFTGVLFSLYGAYLYMDPQYLIDLLELGESAAARTELRAMYGGLQLGVGIFLLLAAQKDKAFKQFTCIVLIAIFAGLSTARAAGMIIDGIDNYNLYACIYEAISLLIAILLYNRLRAMA
jgi:hypothetical protein